MYTPLAHEVIGLRLGRNSECKASTLEHSSNAVNRMSFLAIMSTNFFSVKSHVLPCQHIREYSRATKHKQEETLYLDIKQYTPLNNLNPQHGDVTIIAAHGNGFPKVHVSIEVTSIGQCKTKQPREGTVRAALG